MSEAPATDLDFARYAPEPPRLVWDNPQHQPADDLTQAVFAIRAGLMLVARLILIAGCIVCRRAMNRCRTAIERLLGSLLAAWSVAGLGWGVAIGLPLIQFLAR